MEISAVILAGGLARRMGGVDKGLQLYQGVPLFWHCYQRLKNQVAEVAVNANRNQAIYRQSGLPVFADDLADFQGPLSGMLAGLTRAKSDLVLFVPCDCPFLPLDLVEKLQQPFLDNETQNKSAVKKSSIFLTYATDGEREHPTFCLVSPFIDGKFTHIFTKRRTANVTVYARKSRHCSGFLHTKNAFQNFNHLEDLK